jgi:pilus assembly protein Flp/PilA
MKTLRTLCRNIKGATAIEYGLIAALISVAGITAFTSVGNSVKGTFNNAATKMK